MTPEIRAVYEEFPRWKLYGGDGDCVRRAYGVCQYEDQTFGLHMVTLMLADVVSGVPVAEVKMVEEWSQKQLHKIALSSVASQSAFLDPLGG